MKALVLKEYKRFAYEEVPAPEPGEGDLLVAVKACGICGSDVHGMDGSTGRRIPPIIMGHEASGVIAGLGPKTAGWKAGERVTFDSTIYCGECRYCRRGLVNLCDRRRVIGVSCPEYRRDGAFAEFVAVPQHIVYRVPDAISFAQAAMVEAVSIAVHAMDRTPLRLNDTAVVVGAGMIGLLVVQVLRAAGAGKILAVDVSEKNLELAKKLGADEGLRAEAPDLPDRVRALTSGRGADLAFEVVGVSDSIKTAVRCLRKGGSATLVGNISPLVELPLQETVTRQISLIGTCASAGEYPACLDLIAAGRVNVDALISAVAPLAEGANWFDRLYRKEPGLMKVILQP